MTSIPKKSTPLEPLEKKVLPSLKSSSATSLDLISPQPVLAPFESLEKQVLRDLKPAKGVSLKVASGSIKESNILDIIEENPEIAQERMSKEQYMKLRAEQESSIYNTLRANYAKMSRQQTKYAQIAQSTLQTSTQSNLINIVETSIKQPISEIDIEKNIDDNFAFDSNTPISQTKKKTPTSNIFTIEPKNFKKKPISSAEIAPIGVKEKPEKSRTDTETSITFCNDPKLINYFFEADKKVSHNNMISPRDPGLAPLSDTKNRARDMVEERPREEEFSRFYNKENDQKTSFIGDVPDARRPGSVVRFAEQTFNDPYLITPEKNKIKLPKAMSFGTRTRDRFKIQAPRLKKMHDYFS